jgi:hypothetical protein
MDICHFGAGEPGLQDLGRFGIERSPVELTPRPPGFDSVPPGSRIA